MEHRRRRRAGLRDGRAEPARPRLRRRRRQRRRSARLPARRAAPEHSVGAGRSEPGTSAPAAGSRLMPKDVDHDERREQLAESVWRVVARDGLEGATIRGIATETGWSAGSLAHYFTDKDDILDSALRIAYERIAARWDARLEGLTGIAALRELVLDNLPLDDQRELETEFLMNYWSRAIRGGEGTPRPPHRG